MTEALIIGALLALGGGLIWAVVRGAEAKGAAQEQRKAATEALDDVRKANEAVASVDAMPSDTRRKRLQQWARD